MKRTIPIFLSLLWVLTATAYEGTFSKDPIPDGGLYISGPNEGFGINLYYSDDYGQSLNTVVADTIFLGGFIADAEPGYLISHNYDFIELSRDYGVTWEYTGEALYKISAGRIPGEIYTFDYIDRERVLKYSTNYGSTYDIHYPNGLEVNSLSHTVGHLDGEFYVIDIDSGSIYRSNNYGEDFTQMGIVQVSYYSGGTRLDEGTLPGELYFYDGPTGDLYFSSDSGMSFEWKYNFPDTSIYYSTKQMQAGNESGEVFFCLKRTYYTGGGEIFIYYSDDYGETFTEFHPFSTTVGAKESPELQPFSFDVSCYPNPSNSSSIITLEFPVAGNVTLQLFDIHGRDVGAKLLRHYTGIWLSPGLHQMPLNFSGLPSGRYYCHISIGNSIRVIPIVHQK